MQNNFVNKKLINLDYIQILYKYVIIELNK
jgi:hypothetical protein